MDGTLIDAVENQRLGWHEWAHAYGLDADEVYRVALRMRPTDVFKTVLPEEDPEECLSRLHAISDDDATYGTYSAFEGASKLLASLPSDAWAVVTSNYAHRVRLYFKRSGLPEPVVIIDAPAAKAGKPAPDPYLLAAELLGARPEDCLVIEDAASGITAGLAAGMTVWSVHAQESEGLAHRHFEHLRDAVDPILEFVSPGGH